MREDVETDPTIFNTSTELRRVKMLRQAQLYSTPPQNYDAWRCWDRPNYIQHLHRTMMREDVETGPTIFNTSTELWCVKMLRQAQLYSNTSTELWCVKMLRQAQLYSTPPQKYDCGDFDTGPTIFNTSTELWCVELWCVEML